MGPRGSNSVQSSRFGVEKAAQPRRRDAGKAHRHGTAAAGLEPRCAAIAKYGCAERIRHHQATFIRDQRTRKVVWHGKVKTIREVTIGTPLAVGTKIGHGTLDLDNHEVAGLAESENIGAPAIGEREFHQARIAELLQDAADP